MFCVVDGSSIKNNAGFILLTVLIFLWVLTFLVISGTQEVILENKMQAAMQHDFLVFSRAEMGLEKERLAFENQNMRLPDSDISVKTLVSQVKVDRCGNQIIEIQSIAKDAFVKVILNSRDIFAKVPKKKKCKKIPRHQCLWWREN